ncbi:unnamed protein product, partial [Mesorhabditis belari]|uniref:Uncharacterized protein n=1 Tax=Mesorhabditis belari TaxID=2138241 RepID=A0AAF3FUC5_9BILA
MESDSFSKRRELFANEDFEKTIQNIICSPRKGKHYPPDDISVYDVTEKQKSYYRKCFLHLMKQTQNSSSLSGALHGSDAKIVDFFRKSGLNDEELSRIWSLSDVNEDGWLDLAEFCTAMHLIVLRVKGELPIPPVLPPVLKPPMTAPRTQSQISSESSRPSAESQLTGTTVKPVENLFEEKTEVVNGRMPVTSRSEEQIHKDKEPTLAKFSDVPPLLVDGRPTAIKPLPINSLPEAVLSLKSPQGPPPVPPPRPTRGHMRSASLDLKQLAIQQQQTTNGLADPFRGPASARHMSIPSNGTIAPPVPLRSDVFAVLPPPKSLDSPVFKTPSLPPEHFNFSSKPSPPSKELKEAVTQTENEWIDPNTVEKFINNFGSQIQGLMVDEEMAETGEGPLVNRWTNRVQGLRKQNADLERERARLAQIRMQLELRLQEVSNLPGTSSAKTALTAALSSKPTQL